jgi:acetyl esterase/lipase
VTAVTPRAAEAANDPTEVIRLWPVAAPGGDQVEVHQQIVDRHPNPADSRDRYAEGVIEPTLTVFRPAKPDGSSLLIAPGGGYIRVMLDNEGFEAARVFAAAGVTCFVLRYRFPGDGWAAGPDTPLQDAQRAMRLVRADAAKHGRDVERVGVLGFSAGGHVAATLASLHSKHVYAPVDASDDLSAKPCAAGLVYPVISMQTPVAHEGSRLQLIGAHPNDALEALWSADHMVSAETPPCFLVHAFDDGSVPVENSLRMAEALHAAKIPAELHVFEQGGHGFGLRLAKDMTAAAWPELFLRWGRRRGWFRAG